MRNNKMIIPVIISMMITPIPYAHANQENITELSLISDNSNIILLILNL